ncbi:hypothetical protein LWI29_008850 [Acer saccharum]|uniref:Uncharacterized protein n=1 Tax=Acer saccharum TaxID=4024 RepID=A0AA39RRJ0_ACESA|nr:hypothetical protein LWI29_008850 [Acer saccharum]
MLSDLHNPNQQGILKNFFNLFSGTNMAHKKKMDPKALRLVERLWKRIILLDDYMIAGLIRSPSRLIFDAAEQGNDELLSILRGSVKDLMVAVDYNKDNILHLAAKLPPPNRLNIVSGAALQLQRELLWFKELSNVAPLLIAEAKNKDGLKTQSFIHSGA